MVRRKWLYALIAIAFSLVLAACGGGSDDGSSGGKEGDSGKDTSDKNTLVIAQPKDIDSFDIHNQTSNNTEAVVTNMFSYLYKRTDGLDLKNDLAESYEIIEDNIWEFKLREDVTFHNGDPLTAEDVKFTFERVAFDDTLIRHSYFNTFEEVEVVDDYTVRIHTKDSEPILLNRISRNGSGILPKKYIEEHGIEHFMENPIGSGPYQFVEWERDSHVTLKPYEDHFEVKDHEWEEVVFRVIPETSTRINELISGGVDIISDVPPNEIERIDENSGTSIVTSDSTAVMQLIVRQTEGTVTADPKVREAIDYAINNELLIEDLAKGAGMAMRTRATPGTTGAHTGLHDTFLYDPEYAKELLAEAGYEDGLELTLQTPQSRYVLGRETSEVLVQMLGEVGIKVNLELMEDNHWKDVYDARENKELMFVVLSNSLLDASHALNHFYSETYPGRTDYHSEEFDELFLASQYNMDPEERDEQLKELQEMVAEDRPYIYLYQVQSSFGVSDDVEFITNVNEHFYIPSISKK